MTPLAISPPVVAPQLISLSRVTGVVLAVIVSYVIWWHGLHQPPTHLRLWLIVIALLAGLAPTQPVRLQPKVRRHLRGVADLLVATVCTGAAAAAVAWIADERPPLALICLILISTIVAVSVSRWAVERGCAIYAPRSSFVVYGHNELGIAVARFLSNAGIGVVAGIIDENVGPFDNYPTVVPVFRNVEELEATRLIAADMCVVVAQPTASPDEIAAIRIRLRRRFRSVLLAPPSAVLSGHWPVTFDPTASHCFLLGVTELQLGPRIAKRIIDIVIATIALVAFAPVMLVAAILIKLESPGPVIFRQRRYTTQNRLFSCYKLRTMRVSPITPGNAIELTLRGDARLTRTGNFLRKTSLDEVPQFVNVLQGHMSVVGPRPHPPGVKAGGRAYEDVIADFDERYKVKPGITGFAQISGLRGNTFTEEDIKARFRYDLEYIANWSVALEVWIIIKTFFNGFWGKNAF